MPKLNLFLDSSALFAGVVSSTGASRVLLLLGESEVIQITISEQVITETERAVARKAPQAMTYLRKALRKTKLRTMPSPSRQQVEAHQDLIIDPTDVPIVLAAMNAHVDYLVTLNRRHFIDDPGVAEKSGLRIGSPGDALAWVRQNT